MAVTESVVLLESDRIRVEVDLGRGAEIAGIHDLGTGVDILMTTPWASAAREMRPVKLAADPRASEAEWTASYGGGWQTLVPHAGEPEEVDGVVRHYHGEGSAVAWELDGATEDEVRGHLELETVPLRIDRTVSLAGAAVTVTDVLTNVANQPLAYDYQSHPAFGAPFLDADCRIELDAERYLPDPRFDLGELAPGVAVDWPRAASHGVAVDLAAVPAPDSGVFRFGWLEDFATRSVRIANPRLGLAATLEWDEDDRDRAWFWLDAGSRASPPWDGRGYVLAIEPSTRATVRDRAAPRLAAGSTRTFTTRMTISTTHP
ncbi:hypothetical protein GCM10025867_10830 [Frondihabitans sucicola]|uniref:DUF4432 family protein n=1 Tax=Frondihabitans sucicola TaxID=1268041 RepID=A0ABN6XY40_9MICO|nr:DUF4432 family protein [Frondihabitans sucicola]BDZ48842.1 hypothetical protein GCM10025867_10830 [Frondihabitans sucicola]